MFMIMVYDNLGHFQINNIKKIKLWKLRVFFYGYN